MLKVKLPNYICFRIWYIEISLCWNISLKQLMFSVGKRPIFSVTNKITKGRFIEFNYNLITIRWTKQNNS